MSRAASPIQAQRYIVSVVGVNEAASSSRAGSHDQGWPHDAQSHDGRFG
jgi:hypothetical protein